METVMRDTIKVFIGADERMRTAAYVCEASILSNTRLVPEIMALYQSDMRKAGLYRRPYTLSATGDYVDMLDGLTVTRADCLLRFFAPLLCGHDGWAVYLDSDTLVLNDLTHMLDAARRKPGKALYCVKQTYPHVSGARSKYNGHAQTVYPRKLWTSVMLIDCSHPYWRTLTPAEINTRPIVDLLSLSDLPDAAIGSLDSAWHVISGVTGSVATPYIIHYTHGGAWVRGMLDADIPYIDRWWTYYRRWQRDGLNVTDINGDF